MIQWHGYVLWNFQFSEIWEIVIIFVKSTCSGIGWIWNPRVSSLKFCLKTLDDVMLGCLLQIKPAVSTVCFGIAASQGALLLAGGEKGKRFAMPNARIMIHQPQGGCGVLFYPYLWLWVYALHCMYWVFFLASPCQDWHLVAHPLCSSLTWACLDCVIAWDSP